MKKIFFIVALGFFLIEGYAQRTATIKKIVNDSVTIRLKISDTSELLAKRDTLKFALGIRNSIQSSIDTSSLASDAQILALENKKLNSTDTANLLAKRDTAKFANGIRNSIPSNLSNLPYVFFYPTSDITVTPTGITASTASDFMSITIPSAGLWMIDWSVLAANTLAANGLLSILTDNSNNIISEPFLSVYNTSINSIYAVGHGKWFLNTTSSGTYKIRVFNTHIANGSAAACYPAFGKSWVSALKIQ